MSDDYECDATSLHLRDRASQIQSAISPGSSGWAGWKSALWIMNYLQIMHDVTEAAITQLQPGFDLASVGQPDNGALGVDIGANIGTYLGSSDIEGFQAGMMILGLDNEAQDWLMARTTTDGTTLGGFPDLKTALAYDMNAPLRWFPGQIAVTETTSSACSFPKPATFSITDGGSHLLDLAGLLGAYASLYALTDQANAQVGGSHAVHGLLRRRSVPRGRWGRAARRQLHAARSRSGDDARRAGESAPHARRPGVRASPSTT